MCAVAFQGKVACFDISSGNTVWSRDMSSAVGLTLEGRHLYVTDDKGAVYALDIASGASIWKQDKLLNRGVGAPVACVEICSRWPMSKATCIFLTVTTVPLSGA